MLELDIVNHERSYDKMLNKNIMWCLNPDKILQKRF